MPDEKQLEFGQRVRRILRRRRALSRGFVIEVKPDGLLTTQPRRDASRNALRSLLLVLLVLLGFKGFLLASLGEPAYFERLARLQGGSLPDRLGAYVMYPDPASAALARLMAGIVPS